MRKFSDRKHERGTSVAEFAMVALFFFILIFGIIEFGRLLYTHNALADATRRGARFAVLHEGETDAAIKAVQREVVYGSKAVFDTDGNTDSPPLISGLTTTMVKVTYQGEDLDSDPTTDPEPFGSNLGTATVKIEGFQFNLLIPVVGRVLNLGDYATTLSAESAGEEPDEIGPAPAPPPPAP